MDDAGGVSVELLPQLEDLVCSQAGSGNTRDVFISFSNASQNTGSGPVTAVTLIRLWLN